MLKYDTKPLATVLLALAVLAGCATVPKKESDQACLVVIPTSMVNETGQIFARNYYLQFSDRQKERLIPQFSQDTILVVVNEPGVRITGIRSVVDISKNFQGPDGFEPMDVTLPYVPGKLVVADDSFQIKMTKHDSRNYSSGVFPQATDPVLKESLLEKYQIKEEFAPWFAD